jgi:hypothetical protein
MLNFKVIMVVPPRVREIAENLDQAKALAHQHHILIEFS